MSGVVALVGNARPASRTHGVASAVAAALADGEHATVYPPRRSTRSPSTST